MSVTCGREQAVDDGAIDDQCFHLVQAVPDDRRTATRPHPEQCEEARDANPMNGGDGSSKADARRAIVRAT